MTKEWQELKETIIELRDNDGTGTQQEVCKFLANYMDVLEKQMQEPNGELISKQVVLDTMSELNAISFYEAQEDSKECYHEIRQAVENMQPVNPQSKTGHWIEHEHNGIAHIECSECSSWFLRAHLLRNSFCPNCGARMESEGK